MTNMKLLLFVQIVDKSLMFFSWNKTFQINSIDKSIKSYLFDCCDRMHIPSMITETIYDEYVHFRCEAAFDKITDTQLMAYSIYLTLKNEGIGRNIKYVAQNTGIASKLLWKCESLDPYLATPINIENLLAPVYSSFDLSRED